MLAASRFARTLPGLIPLHSNQELQFANSFCHIGCIEDHFEKLCYRWEALADAVLIIMVLR